MFGGVESLTAGGLYALIDKVCYKGAAAKMLYEHSISTLKVDFYDITAQVKGAIAKSGVSDGAAIVFCPHTTAGITINENADLTVVDDLLLGFERAFPDRAEFKHSEGNSSAHLRASGIGSSVTVIISGGKPILGIWQGIYFCEFDPPRSRKFFVKVMAG